MGLASSTTSLDNNKLKKKHNQQILTALTQTFDPSQSIPYDRSATIDPDDGKHGNPLQTRKLHSSLR